MRNSSDIYAVNDDSHRYRQSRNDGTFRDSIDQLNCSRQRYRSPTATFVYILLFYATRLIVSVSGWVEKSPVIQLMTSLEIDRRHVPVMERWSAHWSLRRTTTATGSRCRRRIFLSVINDANDETDTSLLNDASNNLQWQLFCKHHARYDMLADDSSQTTTTTTSWIGKWTTYDYVGDVVLETMPASVNYLRNTGGTQQSSNDCTDKIDVTHTISTGSTTSDCETCFDDASTIRTIPITSYTPENIGSKSRLGACGMVVGPSIMRSSGTMATELVLSHTNSRVRIVFQHAPVWARGTEAGSCPPQGLKLIRCLLARESLDTSPRTESTGSDITLAQVPMPGTGSHPIFDRSVPPFDWHKKWSGTSWTWGPEAGDRGWSIPELEIGVDDWQGCAPVEAWNLRLPGGIFIQLPRVVTGDVIERCRLAWMPDKDTLLRLEAGVIALQPRLDIDDDTIVGFEPPSLATLRCDVLQNEGDLEGVPSFVQQQQEDLAA